jgi:hypothetical protein
MNGLTQFAWHPDPTRHTDRLIVAAVLVWHLLTEFSERRGTSGRRLRVGGCPEQRVSEAC